MNIKNYIKILLCVVLAGVMSACKSGSFKISGDLKNLGTQNLRVVYISNDVVNSKWQPVIDGKFEYEGTTDKLAVVEIYNRQMELLARVAVENGDKIAVNGDVRDPYHITVKGSDVNEEWSKFINDNANLFKSGNRELIEKSIEKYVHDNPNNLVSGMLLAYNYATVENMPKVEKMLGTLADEAKPDAVIDRISFLKDDVTGDVTAGNRAITSFLLYSSNADSIESLNPSNSRVTLLYFWASGNTGRSGINKQLKRLKKDYANRIQIADITLENDSSIWKKELKTDSTSWKHFWGLGGIQNAVVRSIGVSEAPYFVVVDSIGKPLYRGASLDAACLQVDKKLK